MQQVISLWLPTFSSDRLSRSRQSTSLPGGSRVWMEEAAAADRRALDDLADWCGQYAPRVSAALEGSGAGMLFDVALGAQLFGGPAAILTLLIARIRTQGYRVQGALAETIGASWALARHGDPATTARDDSLARVLAPLPVEALRLGPELALLKEAGLDRIGALYRLERADLVRRFGQTASTRLDQALGNLVETVIPRRPVSPCRVRLGFPEAVGLVDPLAAGVRRALGELAGRLERADRSVRRLELAVYRLDGAVRRLTVDCRHPSRDPDHLMRQLARHLDKLDLAAGVEAVVLSAIETVASRPQQLELAPAPVPEDRAAAVTGRLADRIALLQAARQAAWPPAARSTDRSR